MYNAFKNSILRLKEIFWVKEKFTICFYRKVAALHSTVACSCWEKGKFTILDYRKVPADLSEFPSRLVYSQSCDIFQRSVLGLSIFRYFGCYIFDIFKSILVFDVLRSTFFDFDNLFCRLCIFDVFRLDVFWFRCSA